MIHTIIISNNLQEGAQLRTFLQQQSEDMKIEAISVSADEGRRAINSYQPDLVFLDTDLPKNSAFSMLEALEIKDFLLVFTGSTQEKALSAIPFHPIDFLLKPYSENQLIDMYQQVQNRLNEQSKEIMQKNSKLVQKKLKRIAIPDNTGYSFMEVSKIMRIESASNSSFLFLENRIKVQVNKTLREFEEILGDDFFRIHQSHIINLNHAKKYLKGNGGYIVMTDGTEMEVSRRRKEEVLLRMAWM